MRCVRPVAVGKDDLVKVFPLANSVQSRVSLAPALLLLGALGCASLVPPAAAQTPEPLPRIEGRPDLVFGLPAPADCVGTPRPLAGLDRVEGTPRPWPESAREDALPGTPASAAVAKEVGQVAWAYAACLNAGDWPRALGMLTDAAVRDLVLTGDLDPEELAASATPAPLAPGQQVVVNVREARQLPDGRVGAVVDWCREANFVVFAPDPGPAKWRIDEETVLSVSNNCLMSVSP